MAQNNQPYSEFGYYLHLAVALIDKSGEALFQRELGISLRQFMLLRLFETTGTLPSQQVLVARLGIAKSAVSRHIDIARRNGWIDVQTAAVSRRQNNLILTADGKRLLAQAKKLIAKSELQGFKDVPITDMEATLRTLKTLCQKMQA